MSLSFLFYDCFEICSSCSLLWCIDEGILIVLCVSFVFDLYAFVLVCLITLFCLYFVVIFLSV